jgi:vesicle coat complex subunit
MYSKNSKKGSTIEKENLNDLKRQCQETESVDEIIELSKHKNPEVRLTAIKQLCPCRVQEDIDKFWNRLFEMVEDEDAKVRYQILHNICDGSPEHLESRVVEAIEKFNRDEDKEVKRRAHKVLASYLRTGKWNVL